MPRQLSPEFLHCLLADFLKDLTKSVAGDKDLNLEVRTDYLNIYYKGNSLLKLTEITPSRYKVDVNKEFRSGIDVPSHLDGPDSTKQFIKCIPDLKQAIGHYSKRSLELEYEQLIIRANNGEARSNSEYFIIDRQYSQHRLRSDLLGFYWQRAGRKGKQEVPLCLFEVKFALNPDISGLAKQLNDYYTQITEHAADLAGEMQAILRQKLELGLFRLPANRLAAMKTLTISTDVSRYQFAIVLVDYNPYSQHLQRALTRLKALPFANQIRLMQTGFGMWAQTVRPLLDTWQ